MKLCSVQSSIMLLQMCRSCRKVDKTNLCVPMLNEVFLFKIPNGSSHLIPLHCAHFMKQNIFNFWALYWTSCQYSCFPLSLDPGDIRNMSHVTSHISHVRIPTFNLMLYILFSDAFLIYMISLLVNGEWLSIICLFIYLTMINWDLLSIIFLFIPKQH